MGFLGDLFDELFGLATDIVDGVRDTAELIGDSIKDELDYRFSSDDDDDENDEENEEWAREIALQKAKREENLQSAKVYKKTHLDAYLKDTKYLSVDGDKMNLNSIDDMYSCGIRNINKEKKKELKEKTEKLTDEINTLDNLISLLESTIIDCI